MIRTYAKRHPEKVVGLVSLDPTFEDFYLVLEAFEPNAMEIENSWIESIDSTFPKVVLDEWNSLEGLFNSPERWKEWFKYDPSIPHYCISSTKINPDDVTRATPEIMMARYEVHERIIRTSEVHMHMKLPNAGHGIQIDAPNITIDVFLMMLNWVRNH